MPDFTGATTRPPRVRPLRSMGELRRIRCGWLYFIDGLKHAGDVVEWSIGPMHETVFFHPDDAAEIFAATGANGPLGRTWLGGFQDRAEIIGNNGLVMSEGAAWRKHRRILQPGMHKQKVSEYANAMVSFAESMCDQWGTGGVVRMQSEMATLTRRIMARTLFGAGLTDAESDEIKRVMDRQLLLNSIEFAVGNWLPPTVPTPLRTGLRRSSDRLKSLFSTIVERRLDETDERDVDLLDLLLEARDEDGFPLPRRQLFDEMHNMYLGGYETSSNSLGFIAALLARDSPLQDRIAAEVERVAGGGKLVFGHINALRVTESVVKEALRLYPPIFALPGHVVKAGVRIGDYEFQPGQRLVVCPYTTHRDPRWFADPDRFRPDRWLDGSTKDIPRYAWMPFGGGPRLCYGQPFAMAEMVLALAVMVRRFSFSLPLGASREIKATLSPTLMLRVKNDTVLLRRRCC